MEQQHLTTLKEMRDELIKDAGHPVYAKQWEKDRIEALDAGIKAMELLERQRTLWQM